MKPIIFSEAALNAVATRGLPAEWFLTPTQDESLHGLTLTENAAGIYVIAPGSTPDSRLLVIRRSSDGLFERIPAGERRQVFDRCARIALREFGSSVQLNPRWMAYHVGHLVSVYAFNERGGSERIVADTHPRGRGDVFICAFSEARNVYDLDHFLPDYSDYDAAVSGYASALGAVPEKQLRVTGGHIDLGDVVPSEISKNLTFGEWYPKHLSRQQLYFVNHELAGPIRLRGAAGTGKTLAMIIKAIKTVYDAEDRGMPIRVLYATHSWAGAEFVDNVIRQIDTRNVFKARDDGITLDVFPLLTLSQKRDYSQIGFRPLGIDSSDGKKQALAEITEVITHFTATDWVAYRPGTTEAFQERVEAPIFSKINKLFSWDLLIEFGCVIAAQGILTRAADRQKYLRVKRMRWMMSLANNIEKEVVFHLWASFLARLRSRYLVSSDQIIFDCLSDLGTFFWESARRKEGYDVIFVDEMHLFNSQERLIFHNLLRDPDLPPKVVMALDPNQSPRETFVEVKSEDVESKMNIYDQARLPNPERIDFTEVYRYTPEINELIKSLNEVAPALDLPEDWNIPQGHSQLPSGEKPYFQTVENALATFRAAIAIAKKSAREAIAREGRVAILCLNQERFEVYATAAIGQNTSDVLATGQNAADVFVIASRDDTERLRYSGKKFVLSTPEYVAGLQFDTVILIDANRDEVPEGYNTGYVMRRFLSELYLGISRAERKLIILTSKDAGGLTTLLKSAVTKGLILEGK